MDRIKAIKVLDMFLHKQCDLGRTSCSYDYDTVWEAVHFAREDMKMFDSANVVILPCNIGDKIYYCRFDKDGAGWITPMIVCGIHITKFRTKEKDGEQYLVCELPWFSRSVHVPLKEFGKTLFLTEDEAKRCIGNA